MLKAWTCSCLIVGMLLLVPLPARAGLETVMVREHHHSIHGDGIELSFKPLRAEPALARFSVEDARAFVAALETEFQMVRPEPCHLARISGGAVLMGAPCALAASARSDRERRVLAGYKELYGPSSLPLPSSLEDSRWFRALKLSSHYMDEGVRAAAMEMLSSPTVAYSMALSLMLYMTAWAVPEPFFSKALAGAVTLGLLMTYSAAELYTVGQACLNLYREAEAARTQEELEAVARRFGRAIGGVGIRVLVTVAGAKLAKGLPEVPTGGMWARLSPPRFAFSGGGARGGGFSVGAGSRAQVNVANGTVVLMGVSANTAASALASAVTSARTTGACRDESNKGDAKRHHLATDKNDISDVNGGPWTPLFQRLFDRAGMSLNDPANIVYLMGHVGPHPEAYHEEVFGRLRAALGDCNAPADCRNRLTNALDKIAGEVCTSGSNLNKLATRTP